MFISGILYILKIDSKIYQFKSYTVADEGKGGTRDTDDSS